MIERNEKVFELSMALSNIIQGITNNLKETPNYIHQEVLAALLESDEKKWFTTCTLNSLICQVVVNSSNKRNKDGSYNKQNIVDTANLVITISDALDKNSDFTRELEEMMMKDEYLNGVRKKFIALEGTFRLLLKKCGKEIENYSLTGEKFFAISLSEITFEFYKVLVKADVLDLISRYKNADKYVKLDIKFNIINPLCTLLEELLIEEKANFFDFLASL